MKNENRMMVMGWLSKWSDADLNELRALINEETHAREYKRKQARQQWIASHIRQYRNCTANHEVVGETVVVAVQWYGHVVIAKATPVKGDVFDLDTGIAVAFAKAMGECIPDYI